MENISQSIKTINDIIEKKANNELSQFNITISQARILAFLAGVNRQVPLKELEKAFNVSQATMQGTIARMEKKGYLCTVYLPVNRRQKLVVLTEYGQQLTDKMLKRISSINLDIAQSLTAEEQKEFSRIINKIHNSLI